MTREKAQEMITALAGYLDGKTIQWKRSSGEWCDFDQDAAHFSQVDTWRIKPTPRLRPWLVMEVPVGALLRGRNGFEKSLIICAVDDVVYTGNGYFKLERINDYFEYSTDGGKTFHPCGCLEP